MNFCFKTFEFTNENVFQLSSIFVKLCEFKYFENSFKIFLENYTAKNLRSVIQMEEPVEGLLSAELETPMPLFLWGKKSEYKLSNYEILTIFRKPLTFL